MTPYEKQLRELAEELATLDIDRVFEGNPLPKDILDDLYPKAITKMLPLAALCLKKMAEAYELGYMERMVEMDKEMTPDRVAVPISQKLTALGYKKPE